MNVGQAPRSSATGTTCATSLNSSGRSYWDMHESALKLDALLFNVLRMSVKGSKKVMLECVQFPSYVQAICVLYKHSDISRNDRITRAFDAMDQLQFNGDVIA